MPLHVKIKIFLKNLLPAKLFGLIVNLWRSSFARKFSKSDVLEKYYKQYVANNDLLVSAGPFAGLKYIDESAGSVLLHKLIGSYEEVLHPTIEKIKLDNFDTIIDIGCAEGYYLIGLGINFPSAKLIGYDTDRNALNLSKKLYQTNQLKNSILLDSQCTFEKLNQQITKNTLLICDAEGFENTILDPNQSPALKSVKTFIVETHEFVNPEVVSNLKNRFRETHTVSEIMFKPADSNKYPFLASVKSGNDLYYLLRERGEQEQIWLVMEKK